VEQSRRQFLKYGALSAAAFTGAFFLSDWIWNLTHDYARLVDFIRLGNFDHPLYLFNDFRDDLDEESHYANLEEFQTDEALITRVRNELGDGDLQVALKSLKWRLAFVPENREEYSQLYENYCRDVIDYVLTRTKTSSPYREILTLHKAKPTIPQVGVTVFIVNNLAKEFLAEYVFSNQAGRAVSVDLQGKLFSGHVGSYSTSVVVGENGTFLFERDTYTIWRDNARNVYTALSVPAEETLHILLREHTEREMRRQLTRQHPSTLGAVKGLLNEWIAVEEAVVGGLVHRLLPRFLKKRAKNLSPTLVRADVAEKTELKKYRYLKKGIELVKDFGCERALHLYAESPSLWRSLLI
jgi:hypothetical protein